MFLRHKNNQSCVYVHIFHYFLFQLLKNTKNSRAWLPHTDITHKRLKLEITTHLINRWQEQFPVNTMTKQLKQALKGDLFIKNSNAPPD